VCFLLALLFCFRQGLNGFLTGAAKKEILVSLFFANFFNVYEGVREFGKIVAALEFRLIDSVETL